MNTYITKDRTLFTESELEQEICSKIEEYMYNAGNKDRIAVYVPFSWAYMEEALERRNMLVNFLGISGSERVHKFVTFAGGFIFVFTNADFKEEETKSMRPLPMMKGYEFSKAAFFDIEKLAPNVVADIKARTKLYI